MRCCEMNGAHELFKGAGCIDVIRQGCATRELQVGIAGSVWLGK